LIYFFVNWGKTALPRPVSEAIADGLPLWDTYEALFFLITGIFLGIVLGFLFPSAWRSFRRSFRRVDKYRTDLKLMSSGSAPVSKNDLLPLNNDEAEENAAGDVDLVSVFVAARYAVQESAFREAAQLYLQILSSERVTRVQTNKAMFELAQVFSLSGLHERAIETGMELLFRKPAHADVFKLLLNLLLRQPSYGKLSEILSAYSGPKSGELARETAHILSCSALEMLSRGQQENAISLAKQAIRWSPSALEPKLTLVEVTSVLSNRSGGQPLEQSTLGFFVDLSELFRLWRSHSGKAAFTSLPLMTSWIAFFDRHDEQVVGVFGRLKEELLSQIGWDSQEPDPAEKRELRDLLRAVLEGSSIGRSRAGWEPALMKLLSLADEASNALTVFSCNSCSELHRKFKWKCPICQSWDTVVPWNGHSEVSQNGRPASPE
jgi:tetratricopeptide (TPR) repeat protein